LGKPQIAGVSSFGFSGTISYLIVEEALIFFREDHHLAVSQNIF
jgi:acyl transferase domain-containing protein